MTNEKLIVRFHPQQNKTCISALTVTGTTHARTNYKPEIGQLFDQIDSAAFPELGTWIRSPGGINAHAIENPGALVDWKLHNRLNLGFLSSHDEHIRTLLRRSLPADVEPDQLYHGQLVA